MSNQENSFEFHISQNYEPFKLIELPKELSDSLESATPPTLIISPASTSTATTSSLALLNHGTQKYKMNTRSSSNTTFIFRPSLVEYDAFDSSHAINSMIAIARCDETIELVPFHENRERETRKINKWHEKFTKTKELKEKH